MNNEYIDRINTAIAPWKSQIIDHKVYSEILRLEDVQLFMQSHVFAVWDFMSILKSLQNGLTCTSVPWFPVGSADTRYLINEIVVGEESDVDMEGNRISHFELYLNAMKQCGADTNGIEKFLQKLEFSKDIDLAFNQSNVPLEAEHFVKFTFDSIAELKMHKLAAIFSFGREDLIPGMFYSLVNDINKQFPDKMAIFKYYLDRHIEVDGGHHSELAIRMLIHLCGNDPEKWREAEEASVASLKMRIQLWDGVYNRICERKTFN